MDRKDKPYLFANPRYVRRAVYALIAVCVVSLLGEFVVHRHVEHPWEVMFAFYPVYGFVACVLLVLIAKQMRKVLMRGEDYYDD